MNIKYSDFLEVCKAFYKLPKHAFLVFDFLSSQDVFRGTYTELAKNIGIDVSNARKAIYQLFDLGVVYIGKKEFFVLDNWYGNLLKNADRLPTHKTETYSRKKW